MREGGVEGLAPISLLVGPNNSGKSTVLEAIAAVGFGENANVIAQLFLRRGGPPQDALMRASGSPGQRATVTVDVNGDEGPEAWTSVISLSVVQSPHLREEARSQGLQDPMAMLDVNATRGGHPAVRTVVAVDSTGKRSGSRIVSGALAPTRARVEFVDIEAVRGAGALEDAYTRIDEARRLPMMVKALARSMPGLADLRILKVGSDFLLHAFSKDGPPVPAYLAGDGFKRFLELGAAVLDVRKGVALLEEPESFQHPRYLAELATLLHLAAREGTQIILSTHSLELVDLLLLAPEAEGLPYPAVHRMRLTDGKLRATTLEREDAARAREDLLEDLRS